MHQKDPNTDTFPREQKNGSVAAGPGFQNKSFAGSPDASSPQSDTRTAEAEIRPPIRIGSAGAARSCIRSSDIRANRVPEIRKRPRRNRRETKESSPLRRFFDRKAP